MVMANIQGWRGVLVAPPNPLAGIGGALRYAFAMEPAKRSIERFEALLARLDRPFPPRRRA